MFSHSAELDAPMDTDEAGASGGGGGVQYRDGNGSKSLTIRAASRDNISKSVRPSLT